MLLSLVLSLSLSFSLTQSRNLCSLLSLCFCLCLMPPSRQHELAGPDLLSLCLCSKSTGFQFFICSPMRQATAESLNPNSNHELSLEQRFQIIRNVGEECIQEDELRNLLAKKPEPICYDGFEPSGRMHIAQCSLWLHITYLMQILKDLLATGILEGLPVNYVRDMKLCTWFTFA